MELIIMFVAAFIVIILAIIAIFRGANQRIKTPHLELKEQISDLENRVKDLEDNNGSR